MKKMTKEEIWEAQLSTNRQREAVNALVKEFLKFVWRDKNLDPVTPDEMMARNERIKAIMEQCGGVLDARFVDMMFYKFEDVAIKHIHALIILNITTKPKIIKEFNPDIPDELIEVAEQVRFEEVRNRARQIRRRRERKNKDTAKASAKRLAHEEWEKWQEGECSYSSNEAFATRMVDKLTDRAGNALLCHSTITRKWISEWRREYNIHKDWQEWQKDKELYIGEPTFGLAMLEKYLPKGIGKDEGRKLHSAILEVMIPKWKGDEA
jgi:hypothetical protein